MGRPKDLTLGAYFTSEDSPSLIRSVQAAQQAGYSRAWLNDAHVLWEDAERHAELVREFCAAHTG